MAKHVPDAGSYAPVTVLIDERPDGVHLSYDRMASFLKAYGNAEALKVAKDLDEKVEALVASAGLISLRSVLTQGSSHDLLCSTERWRSKFRSNVIATRASCPRARGRDMLLH